MRLHLLRPAAEKSREKTATLHYRLREELRAKLEEAARKNGRTMQEEIIARLSDSFGK